MTFLPPLSQFVSSSGIRVYRIACHALPHISARVFLLLGAGEPTLVDVGSGQGRSTADILAGIDEVRKDFGEAISPDDIRRIILTHGHIDHFGGLADFAARLGTDVEVAVHPWDREAVVLGDRWAIGGGRRLDRFLVKAGLDARQRRVLLQHYHYRRPGGAAAAGQADPHGKIHAKGEKCTKRVSLSMGDIGREVALDDGMTLDGLRFIHTPGHSPGHICILADDILLCGDHILPRTLPQQWPESVAPLAGLRHYLSSLDKIEHLHGINLAAGGHEPVMPDVYKSIAGIRRAQKRRFQRVQDVVENADRRLTLQEIGRRVYTKAEGFFALLALTDVGARVEHLEARGKLMVENDQGVAWVSTA